ncbi:MAG: gluconate kinase [Caulobacteraceae bacterium]|nr:gluconate kinase [Caulobacteraceae bacterium]
MHAPSDPDLDAVSAWLRAGAGGGTPADEVIETHIAQVFLIGEHAYKLKRAVDLGYLDFSTAEKRAWAVRRELDFNRRTAPDIYQAVVPVIRHADGTLGFDGAGRQLETVLRMRRFDPRAVLANTPEVVEGDFAEALGRQVAGFHAGADIRKGGAGSLGYVVTSNTAHLRELAPVLGSEPVEALIAATDAEFARREAELDRRGAAGQLRRCHGDLHLANIVQEHGRAVLFDCIEFNDTLSEIDVLYDLAFLLMDLAFRGQGGGANRVLNGYLDEAARSFNEQALRGLGVLPLFLSVRAAVRAHVTAQQGDGEAARAYVQAALEHLTWPKPVLYAVGGLSGSGKSTLSRSLAPGLGGAPGAVILRSDEIRKRLWGRGPREGLPPEAYAPDQAARVYGRMLDDARIVLQAGRSAILDAVFLRPEERDAAQALAREAGVGFAGFWLEAPAPVMAARLDARIGDASDADARILDEQLKRDPGVVTWRRVDSTR